MIGCVPDQAEIDVEVMMAKARFLVLFPLLETIPLGQSEGKTLSIDCLATSQPCGRLAPVFSSQELARDRFTVLICREDSSSGE